MAKWSIYYSIFIPVGGVHGGEGDADGRGAQEGDGEFGNVGENLKRLNLVTEVELNQVWFLKLT